MRTVRHSRFQSRSQSQLDVRGIGAAGDILALVARGFRAGDLSTAAAKAQQAGYALRIASIQDNLVEAEGDHGDTLSFVVDAKADTVSAAAYAGLVLPGGPDHAAALEKSDAARALISAFVKDGKPVLGWREGAGLLAEFSPAPDMVRDAQAALALGGEIYPTRGGDDSDADAAELFAKALGMAQPKVA